MLQISLQKLPESHFGCSSWFLLADAGGPKATIPGFEPLLTRKHEVFRKSSPNLSTLRGEFEADIHSDRIFARKSAHGVRARFPAAFVAPLIQDRKNPTGPSCFGSTVWGTNNTTQTHSPNNTQKENDNVQKKVGV